MSAPVQKTPAEPTVGGMPIHKYQSYPTVDLPDRRWPSVVIDKAPIWCSVDLRDGNQALINPMDGARKRRMFKTLVGMGFKEIEVGFPSASEIDFDFCRELIETGMAPPDVALQVLTQSRDHLITRTIDSMVGAHRTIIHLYNSTSELQRRVVFGMDKQGIIDIAVSGAELIKEEIKRLEGTDVTLQYSPESFTGTELDFAVEICERVMDVWQPTPEKKAIINLPATVEMATPNVYADQIEWFCRNFSRRDSVIISVHPHNDRGTAVAATELAVMGGADRVEGTLFGNGERTGNVDLITLAGNLFTQGVDPKIDISNINHLIEVAEYANELPVHQRHPYAGELVYTAFSGSHQGRHQEGHGGQGEGQQPGLGGPVPAHRPGRSRPHLRGDQSASTASPAKSGVAYVLEAEYGVKLPKAAQIEFSQAVQKITDTTAKEITAEEIWQLFEQEFVGRDTPFSLVGFGSAPVEKGSRIERCEATVRHNGEERGGDRHRPRPDRSLRQGTAPALRSGVPRRRLSRGGDGSRLQCKGARLHRHPDPGRPPAPRHRHRYLDHLRLDQGGAERDQPDGGDRLTAARQVTPPGSGLPRGRGAGGREPPLSSAVRRRRGVGAALLIQKDDHIRQGGEQVGISVGASEGTAAETRIPAPTFMGEVETRPLGTAQLRQLFLGIADQVRIPWFVRIHRTVSPRTQ